MWSTGVVNSLEVEPVFSVKNKILKTTPWTLYLGVRPRQPLWGGYYGYRASLSPYGRIWWGGCPGGCVRGRRRRDGNGTLLFCRWDGSGALAEDALGHALHVVHGRVHGLRHLLLGLGHEVRVMSQRSQTPAHQSLGENDIDRHRSLDTSCWLQGKLIRRSQSRLLPHLLDEPIGGRTGARRVRLVGELRREYLRVHRSHGPVIVSAGCVWRTLTCVLSVLTVRFQEGVLSKQTNNNKDLLWEVILYTYYISK